MPWKSTKLTYCGIHVRRRTLYVLAMVFAVASVPTVSWTVLTFNVFYSRNVQWAFLLSALVTICFSLNAWRLILKHNIVLFWEEARFLWPASMALLIVAIGLGYWVADFEIKRGKMDYVVPLAFGGIFFLVLLVRCVRLGTLHQKKSSIVRGGPSRRSRSQSAKAGAVVDEEELAEDYVEEEDDMVEGPPGDSAS
jgi:hypothetical protein